MRRVHTGSLRRGGLRLPRDAEAFEVRLDHALTFWRVDDVCLRSHTRKSVSVFERDGGCCAVLGCTSRRNLDFHHTEYRSRGGSDDAEKLFTMCFPHHRGVHGGTVRIT